MNYVYIKSEPGIYTVGFYNNGKWEPESDHASVAEAAFRVHWLNGGRNHLGQESHKALKNLMDMIDFIGLSGPPELKGKVEATLEAARKALK